jgi:hypothetical protein
MIHRVVAVKHGESFMAGKFHDYRLIDTYLSHEGTLQVQRFEILL